MMNASVMFKENILPGNGSRDALVPSTVKRYFSHEILGNAQEVEIELHGAIYRLRLTSQGKLILTK